MLINGRLNIVLDVDEIVCSFEENTCLLDDDLHLNERWRITESTVRKWDNTLNVGVYLRLL